MSDTTQAIITKLAAEAADAAEAGHDSVVYYFDSDGNIVYSKPNNGFFGEAWYDTLVEDPDNPGWLYGITPIRDGGLDHAHQDSGDLLD